MKQALVFAPRPDITLFELATAIALILGEREASVPIDHHAELAELATHPARRHFRIWPYEAPQDHAAAPHATADAGDRAFCDALRRWATSPTREGGRSWP